MSADKHPADVLAVRANSLADEAELIHLCSWVEIRNVLRGCAAQLRRIPALEAERNTYRARLDRAIAAAEEHFGEDAIRYKLSLFQNGRARNVFPQSMDGRWVALQRADDAAHIGLSLRVAEAEAERDQLRIEVGRLQECVCLLTERSDRENAERDQLRAEVEALRADAERYRWLRNAARETEPLVYSKGSDLDAAIDSARKQQ